MNTADWEEVEQIVLKILKDEGPLQNIDIRISYRKQVGASSLDAMPARRMDWLLQKLRNKGLIRFSGSKWMLSSMKKCQHCQGTGLVNTEEKKPDDSGTTC